MKLAGKKLFGLSQLLSIKFLVGIYVAIFCLWLGFEVSQGKTLFALFLTPDQQGQIALNRGDYKLASTLFEDPMRAGLAHYYNEDFSPAAETFQLLDNEAALFNLANSFAHASNYMYSQATYEVLLERNPNHSGAIKNREIVKAIVEEMLALGEHQQQEGNQQQRRQQVENTLEEDIGAEQLEFGSREPPEQLTAEDLLNDPEMAELWMKQVQSDPADFLSMKFQMQLKNKGPDDR